MKKYFFYLIFLILLSSLSYADLTQNLTIYYSFDDSTVNVTSDSVNDTITNYVATLINTPTISVDGILNQAFQYNGIDEYVQIPDTNLLNHFSNDYSFCFWFNTTINNQHMTPFTHSNTASNFRSRVQFRAEADRINFDIQDTSGKVCTPRYNSGSVTDGQWHFLCMVINGTTCSEDMHMYIDNSSVSIVSEDNTIDQSGVYYNANNDAFIGVRDDLFLYFDGMIDELSIYARELEKNELSILYNNGTGFNPSGLSPPPPITEFVSMSIDTSLINNTINYNFESLNFTFNGTIENTENLFNVTIKIDDVTEYELNSIDITDNTLINISLISFEGIINISVNASNNNVSNTTGYFYYNIDTVNPEIDLCDGLFVDGGIYITNEILTWCINFTDSNLFAYEINVTDKTNNIWNNQQYFGENITTSTAINITSYTLITKGNFSIITRVWDSHTTKVISDYKWKKLSGVNYKGISFSNNKFNMTTNTYSNIENWHLLKTKDRYMLNITFNDKQLNQNFDIYIGTNKQINYLPFSKYQGHFIIGRKHWLDWETKSNISNFTIKYISSIDQWRVRFKPQENNIVFKSIGNLNTFSRTYTYEVLAEIDLEVQALNNISINIFRGIKMLSLIIVLIINWLLYIFLLNKVDENKDHLKYVNSIIFMILIVAFNTINESMFSLLSVLGVTVSFFNLFD